MERIVCLDKEIKCLVTMLNRYGFRTYYSCAGHDPYAGYEGHDPDTRGCIHLSRVAAHEPLRAILEWHGLKDIATRDLPLVSPYELEQGDIPGNQEAEEIKE